MKNIEIITTQNVVLQYELAPLKDRILAFLLDMFCLIFALSFLLGIFSSGENGIASLILICIFSVYSLAFEFFNDGQSIGKKAMKIRVIKLQGGRATFSDYAARWVFRLIDIHFSLGALAMTLIMSSAKAQRMGDVIANTAVVKTVPKMDINLRDLLSIHQADKYVPKYLQAKKLQESEALLIKSTLDRHRKFDNDSHYEAVNLLSKRVQEMLGIEQIHGDQSTFLQTILKDYVVLSR